ncbi:asparagine synthase-related protein [Streptomyces jumonjinensis]|uniref:asparagine synthase-related protein n=1 Tax=Streptomyces jumonjinensis TaxID=1945 RepID=UPI003798B3A9
MTLATPCLDNQVIRACLAVDASERGAADRYKPHLSAAFPAGPVPAFVLRRTTKGGFDGVAHAGPAPVRRAIGELLGPDSRMASPGLLPPSGVRQEVAGAASGRPGGAGTIHYAVVAELWLRQVETTPARWSPPPDAREEVDGDAAAQRSAPRRDRDGRGPSRRAFGPVAPAHRHGGRRPPPAAEHRGARAGGRRVRGSVCRAA